MPTFGDEWDKLKKALEARRSGLDQNYNYIVTGETGGNKRRKPIPLTGYTKKLRGSDNSKSTDAPMDMEIDSAGNAHRNPRDGSGSEDPNDNGVRTQAMSNSTGFGHETRLTPLPKHIAIGIAEVVTHKLRFNTQHEFTYTAGEYSNFETGQDWTISANNINSILGGVFTSGVKPRFTTYWTARYNYYSVVGLEYHLRFYTLNSQNQNYTYSAGVENRLDLPNRYLNVSDWSICYRDYGDVTPTSFALTRSQLMTDPQMKRVDLLYDWNRNTSVQLDGFISHEDFVKNIDEIKQDASQVRWTATNASAPALTHYLKIMPRRWFSLATTGTPPDVVAHPEDLLCDIELIYTVQFKELKDVYKFGDIA